MWSANLLAFAKPVNALVAQPHLQKSFANGRTTYW